MIARIGLQRSLEIGTMIGLTGGLGFLAMVLGGLSNPVMVITAQFVVMIAHGINFPCAQAGSLTPFPENAGAAAGLFGFISMLGAFFTGIWVGSSHDGTILPLASISATVAIALFVSARLLARHGHATHH
jgi:DHA1 family bicyclomycin/chloramphenicol resistance-like MFS transporter